MDVCLICTQFLSDECKTIKDSVDGIEINNMLVDLNFKVPIEKIESNKICYECCNNLGELYKFRHNCGNLMKQNEERIQNICQICCLESENLLSSTDSTKVSEILEEICNYEFMQINICMNCNSKLMDVHNFYIKFTDALKFWKREWKSHAVDSSDAKNYLPHYNKDDNVHQLSNQQIKIEIDEIDVRSEFPPHDFNEDNIYQSSKNSNEENLEIETNLTNKKQLKCGILEKSFECGICSKLLSSKLGLIRHLKVHTGEKPYKCNICSKSFSQKGHFQRHLTLHTGEKPYKCNICSKSFSCKQSLERHLKLHTSEKLYKCNICSKSFSQKGNLDAHLKLHTGEKPYKCEFCSKSFAVKGGLNIHTTIHTGEKPYKCNICSKSFSRKVYLDSHLRTHTGEKPYKCNLCSKSFSEKTNLGRHLKSHTGEKT